jgi:antitoxin ParD1/3/4
VAGLEKAALGPITPTTGAAGTPVCGRIPGLRIETRASQVCFFSAGYEAMPGHKTEGGRFVGGRIPFLLTRGLRPPYVKRCMEVQLTPDQKAFVRQAIESGRIHREEDAVREALSLWEERERVRTEILMAVDLAEASIARGEGRVITQESMRQLGEEVKQRGRSRLSAEQFSG